MTIIGVTQKGFGSEKLGDVRTFTCQSRFVRRLSRDSTDSPIAEPLGYSLRALETRRLSGGRGGRDQRFLPRRSGAGRPAFAEAQGRLSGTFQSEECHPDGNTPLLSCCLNFLGEPSIAPSESNSAAGYIYVWSTREYPDLLKIGFTTRSVEERVREINSATGELHILSPRAVFSRFENLTERNSRCFLSSKSNRIRSDREFFKVDYATAVKQIGD